MKADVCEWRVVGKRKREGGRERGVFRRQLQFRRKAKRLPVVLAKEGSSQQLR